MTTFYFTYGSEGQPFVGGWTEIEAPSMDAACQAFRAFHPDKQDGLLNCSSVYDAEAFRRTSMSGSRGNLGAYCHEIIRLRRYAAE